MSETPESNRNARHNPMRVELTPEVLAELRKAASRKPVNLNRISLTVQSLEDIDLVGRALTGSQVIRDAEVEKAVEEARERLRVQGLGVDLVTVYSPDLDLAAIARKLTAQDILYTRGPMGIKVYGPHRDRSIDVKDMLRSGRINLTEKPSIQEYIGIEKKIIKLR